MEHGLALVAHHADPLVAAFLLLLHLRQKRNRPDQLEWGFAESRVGSAAAAAQVAHLHGGALHTLEGEEESRLHGDGRFSIGEWRT